MHIHLSCSFLFFYFFEMFVASAVTGCVGGFGLDSAFGAVAVKLSVLEGKLRGGDDLY